VPIGKEIKEYTEAEEALTSAPVVLLILRRLRMRLIGIGPMTLSVLRRYAPCTTTPARGLISICRFVKQLFY